MSCLTLSAGPQSRSTQPDEHVAKGGVEMDVLQLGDMKVKRATYPPGWKFSTHMGAPRCQDTHVGYTVSGRLIAEFSDGTRIEVVPGACSPYRRGTTPGSSATSPS